MEECISLPVTHGHIMHINPVLRVESKDKPSRYYSPPVSSHLTFTLSISTGGPISKATTVPSGKTPARLRVVSPAEKRSHEARYSQPNSPI